MMGSCCCSPWGGQGLLENHLTDLIPSAAGLYQNRHAHGQIQMELWRLRLQFPSLACVAVTSHNPKMRVSLVDLQDFSIFQRTDSCAQKADVSLLQIGNHSIPKSNAKQPLHSGSFPSFDFPGKIFHYPPHICRRDALQIPVQDMLLLRPADRIRFSFSRVQVDRSLWREFWELPCCLPVMSLSIRGYMRRRALANYVGAYRGMLGSREVIGVVSGICTGI